MSPVTNNFNLLNIEKMPRWGQPGHMIGGRGGSLGEVCSWSKEGRFCKPFSTATIRYFDCSEADKAEAWIHADLLVVQG